MSFTTLFEFEQELAKYTGAPYVVVTDGCTHALELCFRYDRITATTLTPYTYLSIPMMLTQLNINYEFYPDTLPHRQQWVGEYKFEGTRIWDSARLLRPNMYRAGHVQCVSFGHGKPLQLGKGGAILTDDVKLKLLLLSSDNLFIKLLFCSRISLILLLKNALFCSN